MDREKFKHVEIEGEKYLIHKMNVITSWSLKVLLATKIVPFLDTIPIATLVGGLEDIDGVLDGLSLDKVSNALGNIDDATIKKLFCYGLSHCYKVLPAAQAQVLKQDGTYGVEGIEHDDVLAFALVFEAIKFSMEGFFDGNRWSSILGGVSDMLQRFVPMSTNSSLPPLSPDTGDTASFGMAHTH